MIDRYKPLRKLATGGMAELFLAKQSGLEGFEKVVVIKKILNHLAMDEEFVTMFLDEARIAAKLSHPNIVQIYDLGKADDSYYIAMEYVSGRNVQHILTKENERTHLIPVEHACRIIAGVCDGLHYAHSRKDYDGRKLNIVHRDISPQNILVSFAGGVKLVDFGIAKASTQLAQTRAGVLKGKYAYMSPEQVRGAKIDHRSDIFSVGLVFYEMLTGHRAFERESSLKTLKAIVQEKPLNPKELNPEIPDAVVKLLSRALEKNPDRRYANAQDMQLAVEDYLDSAPRKSNNVRISRYMYDLFDDELNAEGGTMVVDGIGEVIVPTGQKGELKPRVEEEVDHKTLSAALQPGAKVEDEMSRAPTDAIRLGSRTSQPSARVVRSEQSEPKPRSPAAAPPKASSGPQPRVAAPKAPAARVAPDDDDDDGPEEEEDKTIPVYDLDSAEKRRLGMDLGGDAGGEHTDSGVDVPPPEFSEDRTVAGMDREELLRGPPRADDDDISAATDEIEPSLLEGARRAAQSPASDPAFDEDDTATVDPVAARRMLAKVSAMADDFSATRDGGSGMASSVEAGPGWESGTVELAASDAGTHLEGLGGPSGLHSAEAVVGSGGVIRPAAAPGGEIRPSGAPAAAGIRPAGAPGIRPPGAPAGARPAANRPPTLPPAPVAADGTPVTRDQAPAPGPATPAGATSAPAPLAKKKELFGLPLWMVVAAGGAALFMMVTAIAMVIAIVMVVNRGAPAADNAAAAAEWVTVTLEVEPDGAEVLVDGNAVTAKRLQVPAGNHTFRASLDGYGTFEDDVPVPAGAPFTWKATLRPDRQQ